MASRKFPANSATFFTDGFPTAATGHYGVMTPLRAPPD
jgi:hypothetical protein